MKTVFFDVDTQLDFLFPAGALYVPGAEQIAPALRTLTRFAAANGVQVLSSVDAHTQDDPEFRIWKAHCVAGTQGQQKYSQTLLDSPLIVDTGIGSFREVTGRASSARQIVVEKQQISPFTNANLGALLDSLRVDRYVVYGLVTEYCVHSTVLGLLERKANLELVVEAIKGLRTEDEQTALAAFKEHGARLIALGEALII